MKTGFKSKLKDEDDDVSRLTIILTADFNQTNQKWYYVTYMGLEFRCYRSTADWGLRYWDFGEHHMSGWYFDLSERGRWARKQHELYLKLLEKHNMGDDEFWRWLKVQLNFIYNAYDKHITKGAS